MHSISVIRARPLPERQSIEKELKEFGSTMVVTADELADVMRSWPHGKPKLGLDCVGGQVSAEVAKVLDKDAVLVVRDADVLGASVLDLTPITRAPLFSGVRRHGPAAAGHPARGVDFQ